MNIQMAARQVKAADHLIAALIGSQGPSYVLPHQIIVNLHG